MGLDLDLIVDQYQTPSDRLLGHTRVALERNRALFDAIQKLEPRTTAVSLLNYEDEGVKERMVDAYGTRLTELQAFELAMAEVPDDELTPWNRAVMMLVKHLPPRTRIVFWWH